MQLLDFIPSSLAVTGFGVYAVLMGSLAVTTPAGKIDVETSGSHLVTAAVASVLVVTLAVLVY